MIWADLISDKALLIETITDKTAVLEINNNLFWNLNHVESNYVSEYET